MKNKVIALLFCVITALFAGPAHAYTPPWLSEFNGYVPAPTLAKAQSIASKITPADAQWHGEGATTDYLTEFLSVLPEGKTPNDSITISSLYTSAGGAEGTTTTYTVLSAFNASTNAPVAVDAPLTKGFYLVSVEIQSSANDEDKGGTGGGLGNGTVYLFIYSTATPVSISPVTQTITAGEAITFTATGGNGTAPYTWGGTSGASGAGSTKNVTFPTAGTYTVTVFRANGGSSFSIDSSDGSSLNRTLNINQFGTEQVTLSATVGCNATAQSGPIEADGNGQITIGAGSPSEYTATYTGYNTSCSVTVTLTKHADGLWYADTAPTIVNGATQSTSPGAGAPGVCFGDGSAVVINGAAYANVTGAGNTDVSTFANAAVTNASNTATATITVTPGTTKADQTLVSISPVSQTVTTGSSVTFTASGGNGTGAYTWGGQASGTGTTKSVTFPTEGTYSVTVYRAADSSFNTSNIATATITVVKTDQAPVTISPTTRTITAGDSITFTAAGGNGTGAYAWGGTAGASGTGTTKAFTFSTAGTYTVTVYRAADANYNVSNTATANITVNPALIATTFSINGPFTYNGSSRTATITASPAGATFTTGGTLSATNAGTYTATATATGSYSGSNTALIWTISKADQSAVSISPTAQTVSTGSSITFTASGGNGTGAYTWGGQASGTGTTKLVTFNTAGTYTVTVYRAGDSNYNESNTRTATITVTTSLIPTNFTVDGPFTYDGTVKTVTITPNPAEATFTTDGTKSATDAGTYTASASANGSYSGDNNALTWTINKANQTVSFTNPGTKTYGDAPFSLTASATSGGAVTFSVVSGPATVSGSTCTLTGAGTVTLRGSQAGNNNWNAAATDVTFTVNTANQTVTISPSSQTVTAGNSITFTASGGNSTGAFTWGGQASGTGTTKSITFATAGTFTVTVYRAGDSNYNVSNTATATITVNVATKTPQASFSASAGSAVYGDTITATASGGSTASAVTWALGTGSTASTPSVNATTGVITARSAGTVVVIATKAGDATYEAATATATATFTPRPITVTLTGTKTYNASTTSTGRLASITAGTLASGDSHSFTYANTPSANVGSYPGLATINITNASAPTTRTSSYEITYDGAYTITKATQATVNGASTSTVYGNTIQASGTGGSGTGSYEFRLYAGGTAPSGAISSTGLVSSQGTGTVLYEVRRLGDGNYNDSNWSANRTITFNKRTITITRNGSKPYDGNTVAVGATATVTVGSLAPNDSLNYNFAALFSASPGNWTPAVNPVITNADTSVRTTYYTFGYNGTYDVVKADQAPLTVKATPNKIAQNETATLSVTGGTGGGSVTYSSAAGGSISGTTFTATALSGTIVVTATKAGGTNYNDATATTTVEIAIPAKASLSMDKSIAKDPATFQAIWSTSGATSVAVSGPGGFSSTTTAGAQIFAGLSEGTYAVSVTAQGWRGPVTRTEILTVTPANVAPAVVLNRISGGGSVPPGYYTYSGDTIAIQANVSDVDANLNRIEWSIDGGGPIVVALSGGAANPAITAVLKEGVNTITAVVFDDNGAVKSETFQMTVVTPTTNMTIEAQAKAKAGMSMWLEDSSVTTTTRTVNRMRGPIQ